MTNNTMDMLKLGDDDFLDQLILDDKIGNSFVVCPVCGDEYACLLNKQMTCGNPMCEETYWKNIKQWRRNKKSNSSNE